MFSWIREETGKIAKVEKIPSSRSSFYLVSRTLSSPSNISLERVPDEQVVNILQSSHAQYSEESQGVIFDPEVAEIYNFSETMQSENK